MPKIRPITDLRNTTDIAEQCHKDNEPIFITKNGYGDLVIMSIEAYDESIAKLELYKKLAEAEDDVKNGRLFDAEGVFDELRRKYNG